MPRNIKLVNPLPSEVLDLPATNKHHWLLHSEPSGSQYWSYYDNPPREQTPYEKYVLGLDPGTQTYDTPPASPDVAIDRALTYFAQFQQPNGMWSCQYGGPMFLIPGQVIALYATKSPIPKEWAIEMTRYLVNLAHPIDGGWGLHFTDKSTVFGTVLNYIALRILGLPASHPVMKKARHTMAKLGGPLKCPQWGKFWMCVLNVYSWDGMDPIPPEFWLLPYWLPIHPGRWWVHTRAVYLPMSYCYGARIAAPVDDLITELRTELYPDMVYDNIDFAKYKDALSSVDAYYPPTGVLKLANKFLSFWETYLMPKKLKEKALKEVKRQIDLEDLNSDYLDIGPVNNVMNFLISYYVEGPDSVSYKRHYERLANFNYMTREGMMMTGTDGVQVWDTSFTIQTIVGAGLAESEKFGPVVRNAYNFLKNAQFVSNAHPDSYREGRLGCWGFSTRTQGYTVSDCTAEALKAVIMIQSLDSFNKSESIDETLLNSAIDVLLSLQNVGRFAFGSFASYEPIRATPLMEYMNSATVFGNIMVEYPYVECTDSVVIGLCNFRRVSSYRSDEVNRAINNACQYILSAQRPDGSWVGAWAVCFTYAHMFATEALSNIGRTYESDDQVRKGCDFLVTQQMEDGGWGENFRACELCEYVPTAESHCVQTAWAMISLLYAQYPDKEPLEKAAKLLMDKQDRYGGWPYEEVEGVFNRTCTIEYPNYKFYFPVKALSMYRKAWL
ncbi:hypothetical protein CANCADRAFT_143341 [Tortispora caseinolytica NRRL Y-17796]|uniref:Terpene cyclase/mutase family member n=1 Tax=Tortispora caseinolytica NRRL Y-17796 TaxID=767744 RepID=A0A1E4TDD4_9ASCO|nr:hypothetical protein CANCADRAFT_143341 [Tortispora caseinolytica NRRL Y-17796]